MYTCNARNKKNKMGVIASDGQTLKLDVIHISEAGVGSEKASGLSGYETLELERSGDLLCMLNTTSTKDQSGYTIWTKMKKKQEPK